jgi:hypothetical protein
MFDCGECVPFIVTQKNNLKKEIAVMKYFKNKNKEASHNKMITKEVDKHDTGRE